MSLIQTLFLVFSAILIRLLFPNRNRFWVILAVSVFAIYWLQPALSIRQMDFWFPTASLGLVLISWGVTTSRTAVRQSENKMSAFIVLCLPLMIGLTRFISFEGLITATRPPQFERIILVLGIITFVTFYFTFKKKTSNKCTLIVIVVILCFLIILKNPALSLWSSIRLRSLLAQTPTLSQKTDLGWLGFSYLAFRIIHTLIDRASGRLKEIKLGEYIIYTIFYPAFLAGPIDRFQRFQKDLTALTPLQPIEIQQKLMRLARGLFRKFIVADTLAFFAIASMNASQVTAPGWLWVMTVAYSFQLFFDFAGYTDIAIATAGFLGLNLPENFNQPYRQPNLTQFWNNWHITLTQWFRAYFFNPLTRHLRRHKKIAVPVIIFITQISTMLVIGLWHGVTINFLIWGIWHGLGLFIHNRWSASGGQYVKRIAENHTWLKPLINTSSTLSTFAFITIGWLWFVLPTTAQAWQSLLRLFGA